MEAEEEENLMKTRLISYSVIAVAVVGVLSLLLVSKPAAQTKPATTQSKDTVSLSTANPVRVADANPASKPTPRLSDGHPDLTGFWAGGAPPAADAVAASVAENPNATVHELTRTPDGSIFYDYAGANGGTEAAVDGYGTNKIQISAPYKAEYAAKVQKIIDVQYGRTNINDPDLDCKPEGVPRAGFGGFVVSNPQAVAVMYEASPGPYYRIIYTDGRPHPTDIDTSYFGHSIGHWDGDTLVVDTVSLDDTTWLAGPGASIHSDKEHVIERWTRKGNQVTIQTTVEDPVMFTKPWVLPQKRVTLTTGDPSLYGNYILPAMCNTNDKEHFRVNDTYKCNWCNSDTVYGGNSDKLTIPDDVRQKAGGGPGGPQRPGGGGGE
jgi:hypothetical protein